jgi:hypothetical protein
VITATLVSSAACRSVDTVRSAPLTLSVTPRSVPGISINSTPVVTICQGDPLYFSTTVTSPGSAPRYQWYVNTSPVSGATTSSFSTSAAQDGDTITVALNSNAVCATDTLARSNKVGIIVRPLVSPSVSVSASSTTPGQGPITFTAMQSGGGATPAFQWIVNNVDVPGETGSSFTTSTLRGGDRVAVRMQSYAECANPGVVTSEELLMEGGVGVASVSGWKGALAVYPNPSTGRFTIAAEAASLQSGERVKVEVLSLVGQKVYERELEAGAAGSRSGGSWKAEVELGPSVAPGQYILRLSTSTGMNASMTITLKR